LPETTVALSICRPHAVHVGTDRSDGVGTGQSDHVGTDQSDDARAAAPRAPLRNIHLPGDPSAKRRARRTGRAWLLEATAFVRDIVATSARIERASAPDGELVVRTDAQFALLATLERLEGCPALADLGRAVGISRQAARELAIAAARAGTVELLPNAADRRIVQIVLTPLGRRILAEAGSRERPWAARLLTGLATREMRLVAHVLRVLRRRLRREEQERLHAGAAANVEEAP
jgi:DNA-binding MarR family transcriptional regulator